MSQMNIIQAVNSALDIVLEKDSNVCIFGEDVGYFGGVFKMGPLPIWRDSSIASKTL